MKVLKYCVLGYLTFVLVMALLCFGVFLSGGPQGLCESASDEEILAELVQLQRMGCPADVVMMILSYLRDKEPEEEYTVIEFGLYFVQLRVALEVLECDCGADSWEPPPDIGAEPPPEPPTCTCDYELMPIEEYNTPEDILNYLLVLGVLPDPLSSANLQQRGEAAAQSYCDESAADDRVTAVAFQPTIYTDSELASTVELCGLENKKDIKGIVDLHREGAFIEFLTQESKKLGFSDDDYIGQYPVPALGPITCPFGFRIHPITNKPNRHHGIDIGTEWHTPIMSIASGDVVGRGTDTYDGRYILIRHNGNVPFYSYYAHLSQWSVSVGDTVEAGDTVGLEGGDASDPEPGYSTGHHLHFEIRMSRDGNQVNPLSFLKRPKEDRP